MRHRSSTSIPLVVVAGTLLATTAWAAPALASDAASHPGVKLIKVSTDPYKGDGAQHATEAEPDTFAHGKTVVSVFQTGRYSDGGSTNTGWGTSTDSGQTWKHGFLPGITVAEGGKWARVSDPAVAYDAKHKTWLVTGLVLDAAVNGRGVSVSSSKDALHWAKPVIAAGDNGKSYDKEWIVCDNSTKSRYYGNCYVEVDITSSGNEMVMTTSTDGGKTWGPETAPAGTPSGLGGQPLVQPDGTVVVPYSANFSSINAFRSTDGGDSWSSTVTVSNISDHQVPGMREEPLPTAGVDGAGRVYVAWDDCRFRANCASNDIVMSTSADGKSWSDVVRIPIDDVKSGRDHFTPGLGVSTDAAGKDARLGLYYYFYPDASCAVSDCRLKVGFISSATGGKTWSAPSTLTGPMQLSWLAQAGGAMVGDYISCSVIGKNAVSVFAVGHKPKGSVKDQAMYSAGPLGITNGKRAATSDGVRFTGASPARSYPLPLV